MDLSVLLNETLPNLIISNTISGVSHVSYGLDKQAIEDGETLQCCVK